MSDKLLKILYINDDQNACNKIKKVISEMSEFTCQFDWASGWNEGLKKIQNDDYDICLLNFKISNMTGIEFLKKANAFNLKTPIIYLCENNNRTNDSKAMEAGACDYIVNDSLNANILERTIRHALERKKYEFQIIEVTEELAIALREIKDNQANLIEMENLKSVKSLAGAVAHEFSQPLQALTNYLSLIRSEKRDIEKYISKAEDMIIRISKLTDNLRNITGLPKKDYMGTKILDIKFQLSKNGHNTPGSKVLIVDDEEIILDTLVEMFTIKGFNCDGTTNAIEALELIKQNEYEIIISDVSMPKMSGPEFFKKVKAMNVESTFIFITGYEVPEKVKDIIKQADGLIIKPISFDQFFENLEQL